MEVLHEFLNLHPDDLWVYNKLQLCRKLEYNCGPLGAPVPLPGWYIVKPAITFLGMGRNARKIWLNPEDKTENFGLPGEFWSEFYEGEHISVDYYKKHQILTIKGYPETKTHVTECSRWKKWKKVDRELPFPEVLGDIWRNYGTINIEFIGGNLIETHVRGNPDFVWGNEEAIPVWRGDKIDPPDGYKYVDSPDYERVGFYIK